MSVLMLFVGWGLGLFFTRVTGIEDRLFEKKLRYLDGMRRIKLQKELIARSELKEAQDGK